MSALVIELQVPDLHAYGSPASTFSLVNRGVSSSGGNYELTLTLAELVMGR